MILRILSLAVVRRLIPCSGLALLLLLGAPAAAEPAKQNDSGARLMVQDGPVGLAQYAVLSPDGKFVLTADMSDTVAWLWDVRTGKQIHSLKGHTATILCVAFSPDGKLVLTGSNDFTARLWDVQAGKPVHILKGHDASVLKLAFSPDGKRVVTGSLDNTARLWDTKTGKQLQTFKGHTQFVDSVAFSPDGKFILTGSQDQTARLWNAQTGKMIHNLRGHTGGVNSVAFSPDGKRLVTGSRDKTARLWDPKTGKQGLLLQGHSDELFLASFSPDSKFVLTGSFDSTARLWDAQTGKQSHLLEESFFLLRALSFSPDGKPLATSSGNATARLWDVQTGKQFLLLKGHTAAASVVSVSSDGKRVLTAGKDQTARLWDAQTGKQLQIFQGYTAQVWSVAFSSDGNTLLTGSADKMARLWDAQTGKQSHILKGHHARVASVAFSPDGKLLLTGSAEDRTARLWDAQTGKPGQILQGHTEKDKPGIIPAHFDQVVSVSFSPDSKLAVTGSFDQTARLWDVKTGQPGQILQGHAGKVTSSAFSPDGKRVLTGSFDATARLWDVQTGKHLQTFQGHQTVVSSVAFSPDGKFVLTGSLDGTARLWDAQTGKHLQTFQGHNHWVHSVAFSPDGKRIVTGSEDNTARVWDIQKGETSHTLQGHVNVVWSVAFSPDGKRVLTGSFDKTARLWDAETGKELCRLVSFTDGTWAVVDDKGRYDAPNGGDVEGLHWVVGLEPIALDQLKERYYDPGLLAKYLGFNKEPLREVTGLANPKLYPEVQVSEPGKDNPKLTILLTNRGGGIGRVVVNLNGKELTPDARPRGTDPNVANLKLEIDLRGDSRLKPGGQNVIEVQAFNAEGYLRSRGMERLFEAEGQEEKEPPQLWAIVVGVSKYAGASLELRYAAKDAEDFASALQIASTRLFGTDKVRLTLLTTSQTTAGQQPTRINLIKALEETRKAKPGDVLVIYLAGHGINHGGADGDFFYLTQDATSADLKDPEVRRQTALSSAELTELLKKIPAQKQVLILDTCASGKALEKLTEKRDVPGSQVRALERVKDRTGLHILAGCAADAVSYEATRYGQGVLTYSLLLGMRGAALRQEQFVDVGQLFGFAADRVPELARDIGGIQRPVIASPRGTSFDIGQVRPEDQEKIPLRRVRPLLLRTLFQDEDELSDVLGLSKRVDERLRDAASRGRDAPLVFVDARELPDGYQVAGLYRVEKDQVTVKVRLSRGPEKGERFTVTGMKSQSAELARKIVAELEKRLGR